MAPLVTVARKRSVGHKTPQFLAKSASTDSHATKLAAIDAMLAVVERNLPGLHSFRDAEITPISAKWTEYLIDVAKFFGVDAVLANDGVFFIAERVAVCHVDELGRPASQVEPGWNRIKLCSIDGKARPFDRDAPQILVSPDEHCFIWQPEGNVNQQSRVTFVELCEQLGEIGARLARYGVAG